MNNTIDIITCDQATFLKFLEENKLKEANFQDMFNKFHETYIQVAKEIRELNNKRCEILFKIRSAQLEYKRLLGHGDIKPVIDANEEDDNEESTVQEQKTTDKRGRKKVVAEKQPDVIEVDGDDEDVELEELENIPKMKTKVSTKPKKETKQTTKTKVETEDNQEIVEEPEQEVIAKKKVLAKKTIAKKEEVKEVIEEVKEEVEEQPVVNSTTKTIKGKTVKKTEETEKTAEPVEEVDISVDKKKTVVKKKVK